MGDVSFSAGQAAPHALQMACGRRTTGATTAHTAAGAAAAASSRRAGSTAASQRMRVASLRWGWPLPRCADAAQHYSYVTCAVSGLGACMNLTAISTGLAEGSQPLAPETFPYQMLLAAKPKLGTSGEVQGGFIPPSGLPRWTASSHLFDAPCVCYCLEHRCLFHRVIDSSIDPNHGSLVDRAGGGGQDPPGELRAHAACAPAGLEGSGGGEAAAWDSALPHAEGRRSGAPTPPTPPPQGRPAMEKVVRSLSPVLTHSAFCMSSAAASLPNSPPPPSLTTTAATTHASTHTRTHGRMLARMHAPTHARTHTHAAV